MKNLQLTFAPKALKAGKKYTVSMTIKTKKGDLVIAENVGKKSFEVTSAPALGMFNSEFKDGIPYVREFRLEAEKWLGAKYYQYYFFNDLTQSYIPFTPKMSASKTYRYYTVLPSTSRIILKAYDSEGGYTAHPGVKINTAFKMEDEYAQLYSIITTRINSIIVAEDPVESMKNLILLTGGLDISDTILIS